LKKFYEVLVIDDDITTGKVISHILERYNFFIDFYPKPNDAFMNLQIKSYDLFIIDLFMPEMNGFECIEKFRKINDKSPVILISSSLNSLTIDVANGFGASGFYSKPIRFPDFLHKVVETLSIKQEDLLDKNTFPFLYKCSQISEDTIFIQTSGCPQYYFVDTVVHDVLLTLRKHPQVTYIHIELSPEMMYYKHYLRELEEILDKLMKTTRFPSHHFSIRVPSNFFFDMEKISIYPKVLSVYENTQT
jgi:CheY-like chemotaxis protein